MKTFGRRTGDSIESIIYRIRGELWLLIGAVIISMSVILSGIVTIKSINKIKIQISDTVKVGIEQRFLTIENQNRIINKLDTLSVYINNLTIDTYSVEIENNDSR